MLSKRIGPRTAAVVIGALALLGACTMPNPAYELRPRPRMDGSASGLVSPGATSSLIGWWKLDESPGAPVAIDSSGFDHHGMLDGLDPATAWVAGKDGGALSFPAGGQGGVQIGVSATLKALNQITVAAWMKRVSASTATEIQNCIASQQDESVGIGETFNLMAYREDLQGFISTSAGRTTGGSALGVRVTGLGTREAWVHVAMTYDGAVLRVFRDGDEVGSGSIARPFVPSNKPFYIGLNKNGTRDQAFEGELDDVVIYAAALAAADIKALAGGASPTTF